MQPWYQNDGKMMRNYTTQASTYFFFNKCYKLLYVSTEMNQDAFDVKYNSVLVIISISN